MLFPSSALTHIMSISQRGPPLRTSETCNTKHTHQLFLRPANSNKPSDWHIDQPTTTCHFCVTNTSDGQWRTVDTPSNGGTVLVSLFKQLQPWIHHSQKPFQRYIISMYVCEKRGEQEATPCPAHPMNACIVRDPLNVQPDQISSFGRFGIQNGVAWTWRQKNRNAEHWSLDTLYPSITSITASWNRHTGNLKNRHGFQRDGQRIWFYNWKTFCWNKNKIVLTIVGYLWCC